MSKNSAFAIQVVGQPTPSKPDSPRELAGQIKIGDFRETFPMSLTYWSVDDYVANWRQALAHLEKSDNSVSCLVSSMSDPQNDNFVSCWPLYRNGNSVFVQNAIIFLKELGEPFNPTEPWLSIAPHTVADEDGNRISEWLVTISAVRQFRELGAYFTDSRND